MCSRSIFLRHFALITYNPHTPSTNDTASQFQENKMNLSRVKSFHYPLPFTYLPSCNYLSSKLHPFLQCHRKKCFFYSRCIPVLTPLVLFMITPLSLIIDQSIDHLFLSLNDLPIFLYRLLPVAFKHIQIKSSHHPTQRAHRPGYN